MARFKHHPYIARIAAKLADNAVQFNKNAVRTFANTRLKTLENFGRNISKQQFLNALPPKHIAPGMGEQLKNVLKGGGNAVREALKNRHRAAKAVAASTPAPAVNAIHRVVNAHGKGIVFRRIRGRIVPVRK